MPIFIFFFWITYIFRSIYPLWVLRFKGKIHPQVPMSGMWIVGDACAVCTSAPGLFWKPSPPLLPLAFIPFPGPRWFFTTPWGPTYLAIRTGSHQAATNSNHVQRIPSDALPPPPLPDFSAPERLLFHTSLENCVISMRCGRAQCGNVCSRTMVRDGGSSWTPEVRTNKQINRRNK